MVKTVFGQYTAISAIQERAKLVADTNAAVRGALKDLPMVLDNIQLEDIGFSKAYEDSIENRMKAEVEIQTKRQNAETEKINAQIQVTQANAKADAQRAMYQAQAAGTLMQAEAEAKATELRGQADAKAIRAKAEALATNTNLVNLNAVDKWNGQLPSSMIPGAALLFDALQSDSPARQEAVRAALSLIAQAQAGEPLYNAAYQNAKECLSHAVDRAWHRAISDRFFHQPRTTPAGWNLYADILLMGLHDVRSTHKKVHASQDTGPAVDAMRALVDEWLPLALAVASLKDQVIKGRQPRSTPPVPENPHKIVKTCACCLRQQAVVPTGKMAHHGYQRPGVGFQTASCPGIRFRPLEISPEGLDAIIDAQERHLIGLRAQLAALPALQEITEVRVDRASGKPTLKTFRHGEPAWPKAMTRHEATLRGDADRTESSLGFLRERRRQWQPETPPDPRLARWADPDAPAISSTADLDGSATAEDVAESKDEQSARPRAG